MHEGPDRHRARGHGLRLHVGQLRGRAGRRARSGVDACSTRALRPPSRPAAHWSRRCPPRHHPAGRGHPVRRGRDGAAARLPRGGRRERLRVCAPRAVRADLDGALRRHGRARPHVAASGCEAVFVSCTNLPTYDVIAPLEAELGMPVLTANQVTMWAALRRVGPGRRRTRPVPAAGAGMTRPSAPQVFTDAEFAARLGRVQR